MAGLCLKGLIPTTSIIGDRQDLERMGGRPDDQARNTAIIVLLEVFEVGGRAGDGLAPAPADRVGYPVLENFEMLVHLVPYNFKVDVACMLENLRRKVHG